MTDLAVIFRKYYRTHFSLDEWSEELFSYLHDKRIQKMKVCELLKSLEKESTSYQHRVESLKGFISVLLFTYPFCASYKEHLVPFAKRLLQKTIFDDFSLVIVMKKVISYFLELKEDSSKIAFSLVPEEKLYLDEYRFPSPLMNIQTALLCSLLAVIKKEEGAKESALKIADFYYELLDEDRYPYLGFWSKDFEHKESELLLSYYLLFYSSYHLLHQKRFEHTYSHLLKRAEEKIAIKKIKAPIFLTLLSIFINKIKKEPPANFEEKEHSPKALIFQPDYALIGCKSEQMSALLTLNGIGTGIGSLQSKDIYIKTFGPQSFPLDGSKGFGIFSPASKESFKDFSFTENSLKGWLRICKKEEATDGKVHILPDKIWMHVDSKIAFNKIDLNVLFEGLTKEKMSFAFFINAQELKVQNRIIHPKSLDRFEGKNTNVQIEGKTSSLQLSTEKEQIFHVLPLAGEGFYWDADFLIAIEATEEPLSLSITSI